MPTTTQTLTLSTPDGDMPAYVASADKPRAGVLVLQEAFGVTPHIQDVTRRIADSGLYAVAPALFHRQGSPELAYDDLDQARGILGELTAEGIENDIKAGLDHLGAQGFPLHRIGVVGFCMGGSLAFYAATSRPLGAAVTFYGGGVSEGRFGLPSLLDQVSGLETPWIGFYGDQDTGISVEDVEKLRDAVSKSGEMCDIVRYPDAGHGFNCDDRSSFEPASAKDAMERTIAWFDELL